MGRERRVYPRYRTDMEVLLHVGGGGRILAGRSWDLSTNGIFVLLAEPVAMHQRVEMTVTSLDRSETLFLAGQVVHVAEGRGLGIRFSPFSARTGGKLADLLVRLQAASPAEAEEPTDAGTAARKA